MRRGSRAILIAPSLLVLGLGLAGCAGVEPWQRDVLASRAMAPDPFPSQRAFRHHVYESREGTPPADRRGGAGCGCD